jgi:2-dehydro-3-deoxyphosphooctonate aldolase (KDO 8-P synthase)
MSSATFEWLSSVSNTDRLFFILGPCALENEASAMRHAEFLKNLADKHSFNLIFKTSFDKANRISVTGGRGCGMDEGLKILGRVRETFQIPVTTDIHEAWQAAPVAQVVDVLQIPAMLCRQTDLLLAAGKTGKPVHIKKGQFLAAETMSEVAKKVESTGNKNIWLCERGFSFGYQNLVVDFRNFPIMKQVGYPVVFDVTHAVQRPSGLGSASSGDRHFVPPLVAAGVVQGIAGVFMEVHEAPEKAISDGPNSVPLSALENLVTYLIQLDAWAKAHPVPAIKPFTQIPAQQIKPAVSVSL